MRSLYTLGALNETSVLQNKTIPYNFLMHRQSRRCCS